MSFSVASWSRRCSSQGLDGQEPLPSLSPSAAVHSPCFKRSSVPSRVWWEERAGLQLGVFSWMSLDLFNFAASVPLPGWLHLDQALTHHLLTSAPGTAASEALSTPANPLGQAFVQYRCPLITVSSKPLLGVIEMKLQIYVIYFSFSRTNRQRVWEEQIPQPTGSWHYKSRFREPADGLARSRNGSRGSSVRSWAASRRGAACAKWRGRGLWWRASQLHLACSEFTEIVLRWRPSLQTPHPEILN